MTGWSRQRKINAGHRSIWAAFLVSVPCKDEAALLVPPRVHEARAEEVRVAIH